ncbi:MAG: hypothetical protein Q8P40_12840 [Nitrospirota bacterium]|nr:hypothetical protein [Nitrospirota bacterium]
MKRIIIFAFAVFIFIPIILLAEQPKVYTDSDLENYKSGSKDDTYQYNKENYKNQRQQEMIENYQMEKDSLNRERQTDSEKQKRINTERQKKIDECVAKAQGMIEESTKAKTRAGANAKLNAAKAMLDSCYGRSSSTSLDSTNDSTGPFISIGGPNFIDTSTGKVRNCPRAMGKPTVDIDRDCLPE